MNRICGVYQTGWSFFCCCHNDNFSLMFFKCDSMLLIYQYFVLKQDNLIEQYGHWTRHLTRSSCTIKSYMSFEFISKHSLILSLYFFNLLILFQFHFFLFFQFTVIFNIFFNFLISGFFFWVCFFDFSWKC